MLILALSHLTKGSVATPMKKMKPALAILLVSAIGISLFPLEADAQPPRGRPRQKTTDEVIDQAVSYLKSSRSEDGSWSSDVHWGITPMVLTGLLRTGRVSADDPVVKAGLTRIVSLANPERGDLANDEKIFQTNYVTSVSILALEAAKQEQYAPYISKAAEYLKQVQYDEGEEVASSHLNYGGYGYRAGTRPDLSNTHFALDALAVAGVKSDDPVFQRSAIFVSRCQNLATEHNTQPWASLIQDGSFIYLLTGGRQAADAETTVTPRPGYGSMTYAGLKSLLHSGVSKEDARYKAGYEWITKNYSVDHHAGRAAGEGANGYHYYLMTMAKSLNALGVDQVVDSNGVSHDWRKDITTALSRRQKQDGSWGNFVGSHMESNSDLDTAYALITLIYCNPELVVKSEAKQTSK